MSSTSRPLPAPVPVLPLPVSDPLEGTAVFLWTLRVVVYGWLAIAAALGGPVVCTGALLAALLVPIADYAGGIWCLFQGVGVALGLALLPAISIPLALWVATWLGVPTLPALIASLGAVQIVLMYVLSRVGVWRTRALRIHRYRYVLNRCCGTVSGVGAATLTVLLFCWFFGLFGAALSRYCDAVADQRPNFVRILRPIVSLQEWMLADPLAARVDARNPLRRMPAVRRLAAVSEFAADQRVYWQMMANGELDALLAEPAVAPRYNAFKADPRMVWAVERRNLVTILNSGHFANALADDAFCAAVARHWPDIRARVSDSQLRSARARAEQMGPAVRAGIEKVTRRAKKFQVQVP